LSVKIPKAIKTLDLKAPKNYARTEQTVENFVDVELNKVETDEETVKSDGTRAEVERMCPSALIMAGGMSSLNNYSQSLRGSVLGLISASKM
jgi:hypothetical protein